MAEKPDLKPDSLVEKLRPDPSQPPLIERKGFLGPSDRQNHCRLYLTPALTEYLEIADADIVHRKVEKDPDAGSRIWIKPTAMVRRGPPKEVRAADLQAQGATPETPASCPVPSVQRSTMADGIDPAMLMFMGPFLWWATVTRICSQAAFTLVPSNRSLCSHDGKTIHLYPGDYKVISS